MRTKEQLAKAIGGGGQLQPLTPRFRDPSGFHAALPSPRRTGLTRSAKPVQSARNSDLPSLFGP